MSTFLNNSKSDPSRPRASLMNDDPPVETVVKGVLNLATKLKQMSEVKQDPNYEKGSEILERCANTIMEIYENKPGNDEVLDDSNLSSGFARQSMG